jgi:hypothetical protein
MIVRLMAAAGLAASFLAASFMATPAAEAATSKQKMATCKFGADEQKLAGAARKSFMAKCTSNKDSPRGPAMQAPKTQ